MVVSIVGECMADRRGLVIGFDSAVAYWRMARVAAPPPPEPEGRVFGTQPLSRAALARRALEVSGVEPPVDTVVTDARHRCKAAHLAEHVWRGPIGEEHLHPLGDGLYVCRICVAIAQFAASGDEIELARLAYEMCGTYGLTPWSSEGVAQDLRPLTSVSELRAYANILAALGVRGASKLLGVLGIVADGSNSPRETDVAIFLATSRAKGGAGLGGFRLNVRMRPNEKTEQRYGRGEVVPDFSWEGVVVEYDSDEWHRSAAAKRNDERKRRVYGAMGLTCLTMTSDIPRSNQKLNTFAEDLERALGVRRAPLSARMLTSRERLRERLFGPEEEREALMALNA